MVAVNICTFLITEANVDCYRCCIHLVAFRLELTLKAVCYKYRKTLSIYVVIITYDGGNVKSEVDHNIFCIREFLILYIKRTGVKCIGHNLSFWSEREWYSWYAVNVLLK